MNCPKCNYKFSKVIHTLRYKTFDSRVHVCKRCKFVYSSKTYPDKTFCHPGYGHLADVQNSLFTESFLNQINNSDENN